MDIEMYASSLPPQRLPMYQKGDKWRKSCVDAVDSMSNMRKRNGRTSREEKQVNYDLMNSILDENDFKYVLDPYGYGDKYGGTPAKMRDINLIRTRVSRLANEDALRPFDFSAYSVGGNAVSIKDEMKKNEMLKLAWNIVTQESGVEGEEQSQFKSFQELNSHFERYQDIREQIANDILKKAFHEEDLVMKFVKGLYHGLISTEEIYFVGIKNGEPDIRVVNPLNFEYDKSPENSMIEDALWTREERYMTIAEIIDEFGDSLSDSDIRDLEEGDIHSKNLYNTTLPGYAYSLETFDNSSYRSDSTAGYIRVVFVTWCSMDRIGFHSYIDENGEEQEEMVDETFKLSKEQKAKGDKLEYQWINTYWQGVKIGDDIYTDIYPSPLQMRTSVNPSKAKGLYVGSVYNNLNSDATSFIELLKSYQYLYVIVWYRLENEVAKAKGKKMVMDLAQIPKSEGIDFDKWLYYFDTMGISFINSMEEGQSLQTAQSSVAKFNQFQALDMTLSNSIGQYIGILDKIESLMDKACGLNPQQLGDTMQRETAKGVETALVNSSYITEYYFLVHNDVKKRVLTHYISAAKYAYQGGTVLRYMMGDVARTVVIEGDTFSDSDYNVYVSNNSKEKMLKEEIKGFASIALQQDKASLSDLINIVKASSTKEIERTIKTSESNRQQQEQERFQQEQETMRQQQEAMLTNEREKRDNENMNKQLDRENELRKAMIVATGFDTEKDRDGNGVPDVVELGKLQLETSSLQSDREAKKIEQATNVSEREKDRQLEREKLKSKEEIEKMKAGTALKNKVSGEK